MQRIHVIGGGLAGFTAAITAAESGALVTVHEAHHTLGGRARTAEGPYRTNDGPHALYRRGPALDLARAARPPRPDRHRAAAPGRQTPLPAGRRPAQDPAPRPPPPDPPPGRTRPRRHRFPHLGHRPGRRGGRPRGRAFRRCRALPPRPRFALRRVRPGAAAPRRRTAARGPLPGRRLGAGHRPDGRARLEPERPDRDGDPDRPERPRRAGPQRPGRRRHLPRRRPRPAPRPHPDVGQRQDRPDRPGPAHPPRRRVRRLRPGRPRLDRTLQRPGPHPRPGGPTARPGPDSRRPRRVEGDGIARAEDLLDLGFPGWRDRVEWRREALATGRTGAVDRPGTTWRDRPAIDRGNGIYLAGDQVAAPGLLREVSFNSGMEAAVLALGASEQSLPTGRPLDLKRS